MADMQSPKSTPSPARRKTKPRPALRLSSSPSRGHSASAPNTRRSRKEMRQEKALREKFIKAAMPSTWGPEHRSPSRAQSSRSPTSHRSPTWPGSPSRSPERSDEPASPSPQCYPWDMKITPPPPKPRLTQAEVEDRARKKAQEKLAAERAAAEKARQMELREQKKAAVAAEKMAKEKEAARRKAAFEAQQSEINDAAKAAADKALAADPMGVQALRKMRDEVSKRKDEANLLIVEAENDRQENLTRRLGEAILNRGISTAALIKEWDKDGDGELSKIEFKQAVRLTLAIKASNDQIDDIFDMLDVDGDGCIDIEVEVRPAIKRIHDECRKGKEREKYAIAQVEYANLQMSAIDECIVAAKAWEELASKVSEMRKKATLDARFGRVIEKKLAEGSTIAEIITKWGGDANKTVGIEDFRKFPLQLKSIGEFHFAGDLAEIKEELSEWFVSLLEVTGAPGGREDGKLDLEAAIAQFSAATAQHEAEVEKIGVQKELEKAKALQVTFLAETARKQKEEEIAERKKKEQQRRGKGREETSQGPGSPGAPEQE